MKRVNSKRCASCISENAHLYPYFAVDNFCRESKLLVQRKVAKDCSAASGGNGRSWRSGLWGAHFESVWVQYGHSSPRASVNFEHDGDYNIYHCPSPPHVVGPSPLQQPHSPPCAHTLLPLLCAAAAQRHKAISLIEFHFGRDWFLITGIFFFLEIRTPLTWAESVISWASPQVRLQGRLMGNLNFFFGSSSKNLIFFEKNWHVIIPWA
jgi:hypothetical protein